MPYAHALGRNVRFLGANTIGVRGFLWGWVWGVKGAVGLGDWLEDFETISKGEGVVLGLANGCAPAGQ